MAFALLNGGEDTPAKAVNGNVTSLLPNAQQVGWIAGALAGLMTKSGTVAFIGAMELDTTLGKYNGFKEAAAYVGQQEGKPSPLWMWSTPATFPPPTRALSLPRP